MQVTSVLVPVDFSDNAQRIVTEGAQVAGLFKAALHLIFVLQNFDNYSGFFVPPVNLPNLEEELLKSAQERMDQFVEDNQDLFSRSGVEDVRSAVLTGDVAEKILEYAEDNGAGLIVMGTHGYKGLERILFGSVADTVVKNSCCPVMTINPYRSCAGEEGA